MPATGFAAGNSRLNTTIDEGHRLLDKYLTPAGFTGALFVNPVASDSTAVGGLIAEADFAANGVPTDGTPIFLQVQIPNSQFPFSYDVAIALADLDAGETLAVALS